MFHSYTEFGAYLCFLKALIREEPKCCHAHWSADNATVRDFKINKKWFKAICQIPVSPNSKCGIYCISTHFGLHYTYFQTNPRTNVQQNFCESLLWYLWILHHCNVQSIQITNQYKQIYTLELLHIHMFRIVLNVHISFGAAPFFRSTLGSSVTFPSHFTLSECYNFCGQNTVLPAVVYCVRTSCTRALLQSTHAGIQKLLLWWASVCPYYMHCALWSRASLY